MNELTPVSASPEHARRMLKMFRVAQLSNILTLFFAEAIFLYVMPATHSNVTDRTRYILAIIFAVLTPIQMLVFELVVSKRKRELKNTLAISKAEGVPKWN